LLIHRILFPLFFPQNEYYQVQVNTQYKMPTQRLSNLENLETERNNFLLHEQRIIQERDEILRNIHNHLEQLDAGKFYIIFFV